MFDADRPILKSEQDRLGRSVFAKYLARCILDHTNPESLVIGLYGGWGTGKTSIINLTIEELNFAASNMLEEEKPVILNFSPWSYSGQNQLIYSFFRRLSSQIRRSDYVEQSEKIIHLLELYISFFTHQPVPKVLRPKHGILAKFLKSREIQEEKYGWESGKDLTLIKSELNSLLLNQKHKFIIFIDNISRIEPYEIKQIFQIVKSMGDYNNTIYVLSIDKEQMIHDLESNLGKNGVQYLEKIIQLPFEIPPISKQDLEKILLDRLYQIVKIIPENGWDNEYWTDLYYSTLKHFFRHFRDITYYINTLSFSFLRVKELVNPVDFFAITALSIFEPEVFCGIRDNKDLFTDFVSHVFEEDKKKLAEDKLRCEEIFRRSKHISANLLKPLLLRLFPQLNNMYHLPYQYSEDQARLNKRICSAEIFDIYFRLSLPIGHMSEPELNAILFLTIDEAGFEQAILRLNKDERIREFLDLLDSDAIHKIEEINIPSVINAFINTADLFPENENNPLIGSASKRVHRILSSLLKRLKKKEQHFNVLCEAIKKATMSLYIIIYEVQWYSRSEQHEFTYDQLEILKELAVDKIIYWANLHRLAEHPRLLDILYAWKMFGSKEECKEFVRKMTQEDKGLIIFLSCILKNPIDQTITKFAKNPAWKNSLRTIEDFISLDLLKPHARALFESASFETLREREQLAILIFLDLTHTPTKKIIPKTSG